MLRFHAARASAIAMVVMAAVYAQWYSVSMGETARPYTESPAAAWWEHANQDQESLCGTAALDTGGWCNGSTADAVQAVGVRFPQSDQNEASLHAYLGPSQFESGPQEPTPTLAPPPTLVAQAASVSGQLTEAEMRALLAEAGFSGDLLEQALRVSHGESVGWQPTIKGDGGRAYGLFQIHPAVWVDSGVCEGPWESLLEPLPNARCARLILDYEAARRYPLWSNWTVKP